MKKLTKKELAWYIFAGVIAVVGLFSLVLGIVGEHLPVKALTLISWCHTQLNILTLSL